MDIVWSPFATAALDEILEFVARRSRVTATKLESRILAAVETLASFPAAGRESRALARFGYRELLVSGYLVVYKHHGELLVITDVRHANRDEEPDTVHEPATRYDSAVTVG